jgi:tetratricopeptide (TPR) repeat protein
MRTGLSKSSGALIALLFATTLGTGGYAQDGPHPESASPESLDALADIVMSASDRATVREASEAARSDIEALTSRQYRLLHEAQRMAIMGLAERGFARDLNVSPQAEDYFDRGQELARESLEIRETSEAYRILADCLNQLLQLRGTTYKMFNAGRARDAADRAVELDNENPLALIASAAYYGSAPGIVGGDTRRALDDLEAAERHSDGSDFVEFLIALWRGRALVNSGDESGARESVLRATDIYPDVWLLRTISEELGLTDR